LFWLLKSDSECFGVTLAQCHILVEVGSHREMSIVRLARELGTDSSSLSRTVDGMVQRGLLRRERNPSDRRYLRLSLTEQGKRLFASIEAYANAYVQRLFAHIPPDKQARVIESVGLLAEAMGKCQSEDVCSLVNPASQGNTGPGSRTIPPEKIP
ncbi:MAG: MarR family winged helix-turn-helix transcriptional regulator, partial [Candidatus Aminicenantales bacterium]